MLVSHCNANSEKQYTLCSNKSARRIARSCQISNYEWSESDIKEKIVGNDGLVCFNERKEYVDIDFHTPYHPRPMTNTTMAKRLVETHLGKRTSTSLTTSQRLHNNNSADAFARRKWHCYTQYYIIILCVYSKTVNRRVTHISHWCAGYTRLVHLRW
jgi:hypothetical protein